MSWEFTYHCHSWWCVLREPTYLSIIFTRFFFSVTGLIKHFRSNVENAQNLLLFTLMIHTVISYYFSNSWVVGTACPESSGSPPSWICLENLPREVFRETLTRLCLNLIDDLLLLSNRWSSLSHTCREVCVFPINRGAQLSSLRSATETNFQSLTQYVWKSIHFQLLLAGACIVLRPHQWIWCFFSKVPHLSTWTQLSRACLQGALMMFQFK